MWTHNFYKMKWYDESLWFTYYSIPSDPCSSVACPTPLTCQAHGGEASCRCLSRCLSLQQPESNSSVYHGSLLVHAVSRDLDISGRVVKAVSQNRFSLIHLQGSINPIVGPYGVTLYNVNRYMVLLLFFTLIVVCRNNWHEVTRVDCRRGFNHRTQSHTSYTKCSTLGHAVH